jgi:ABC-type multidrug transport system ATPase subunit
LGAFGISKRHAEIKLIPGNPRIIDCESSFGVRIDQELVKEGELKHGSILGIGIIEFDVKIEKETFTLERRLKPLEVKDLPEVDTSSKIDIGRDSSNTIQLIHPLISRFHCSISKTEEDQYTIIDHGSTNGTYVNGKGVNRYTLNDGDVIQIGPFRYIFSEGKIVKADDAKKIKIEASEITVRKNKKMILDKISLSIQPGEFVAMLGPSGAGKTTLARVLSNHLVPDTGMVYYNGFPMNKFAAAFSSIVGFVSQENLLRPELTVWETFWEQVILRLPKDSLDTERITRINEVMETLDISHLKKSRIKNLSGGEAKRVHLGIELLSSPNIIFLDEPLAGLDPGLIQKFMELFRKLCDEGHTLLLTTHTLEQIELCNRLIFLSKGKIVFNGNPDEVKDELHVSSVAEVYEKIRYDAVGLAPEPETIAYREDEMEQFKNLPDVKFDSIRQKSAGFFRQFFMLSLRYSKILSRDLTNLILILLQAPLIALLLRFVYHGDSQFMPLTFYFCVTVSAIWIGGVNSVREIAREWDFFYREYKAGLSPIAYVGAKCFVTGMLAFLQALLFAWCLHLLFDAFYFNYEMVLLCSATTVSGAILGLCISAFSNNVNRAVSLLPIIFIPQIFFSGILAAFDRMPDIGRHISYLTISRPVFSLFKKTCILEQHVLKLTEWRALLLLNIVLIILICIRIRWPYFFSRSEK